MESNELATRITRLSLNRRVTMFVLFLTIIIVGLTASSRLKLELFPEGFEGSFGVGHLSAGHFSAGHHAPSP